MKKYKIRYQKGINIYVENIEATNKKEAIYIFYMNNNNVDILEIEEVKDLATN